MSAEARDTGLPGDGVTGGGEPPYMGCWEKNSSRLQEQSAISPFSSDNTLLKMLFSLLFHTPAALRRVCFVNLSQVCGIFDLQGLWFPFSFPLRHSGSVLFFAAIKACSLVWEGDFVSTISPGDWNSVFHASKKPGMVT